MGTWLSKHMQEAGFETPMKRPNNVRILYEDPRSPTSGINRTPITITSTPARLRASCSRLDGGFSSNPCSPISETGPLSSDCSMSSSSTLPLLRKTNSVPTNLHRQVLTKNFCRNLLNRRSGAYNHAGGEESGGGEDANESFSPSPRHLDANRERSNNGSPFSLKWNQSNRSVANGSIGAGVSSDYSPNAFVNRLGCLESESEDSSSMSTDLMGFTSPDCPDKPFVPPELSMDHDEKREMNGLDSGNWRQDESGKENVIPISPISPGGDDAGESNLPATPLNDGTRQRASAKRLVGNGDVD